MKKLYLRTATILTAIACAGGLSSCQLTRDYDRPKFKYEVNADDTVKITGIDDGGNELSAIKVPRTIEGKTVTAIGQWVFRERNDMVNYVNNVRGDEKNFVILPDTIVTIDENAFFDSSIIDITIPDSVREIKSDAFSCARLTSVTVPKNAIIADDAFDEDVIITYK